MTDTHPTYLAERELRNHPADATEHVMSLLYAVQGLDDYTLNTFADHITARAGFFEDDDEATEAIRTVFTMLRKVELTDRPTRKLL